MPPTVQHPGPFRQLGFLAIACLLASYVAIAHAGLSKGFLDLDAYVRGASPVPYQYRILPATVMAPALALANKLGVTQTIALRPPPFNDPAVAVLIPVNIIFLVVLSWFVRKRMIFLGIIPALSSIFALGFLLILVFNLAIYIQGNYFLPYDVIAVCLFFAIAFTNPDKFWSSIAIFSLGALNRETAIFAAGICFFANIREKPRSSVFLFAVQCILWVCIKFSLWVIFRDNPNVGSEFFKQNIALNISYLKNPLWWPQFFSMTGFCWIPCILYYNLIKDNVARRAVLLFPVFILIMFSVGRITEMRIFSEYVVFFYISLSSIIVALSQNSRFPRQDAALHAGVGAGVASERIAATPSVAPPRNGGAILSLAAALLLLATPGPAHAETLHVGPGQRFERPSQAATVAREGDTVLIAAGEYQDCASRRVPDLTIAADGDAPVEITGPACAHGLYAGRLGQVLIRRSRFEASQICHHVKSRALLTEITDSTIIDTPAGDASYLVDVPNGGDPLMTGNTLSKGPRSENPGTAIAIGFEGVHNPTARLRITGNRFENLQAVPTTFVGNRSETPADLSGNTLRGRLDADSVDRLILDLRPSGLALVIKSRVEGHWQIAPSVRDTQDAHHIGFGGEGNGHAPFEACGAKPRPEIIALHAAFEEGGEGETVGFDPL